MYSYVLLQWYAIRNTGNSTAEVGFNGSGPKWVFQFTLSTKEDISSLIPIPDLTRSNKTAIQDNGPDEKWTRKPLAY